MANYSLHCAGCGAVYKGEEFRLRCDFCGPRALLSSDYQQGFNHVNGMDESCFSYYGKWLPFEDGSRMGDEVLLNTVHHPLLGSKLGVDDLWLCISGYSPVYGSNLKTGTFKECEAIGVLNRVRNETNKILIVSSAGNSGRAFLEYGSHYNYPAIVVMPEDANSQVNSKIFSGSEPLLILLKDAHYPEAIKFVDDMVSLFGDYLVREGGCFNVARRDAMAVPFLRAVRAMGGVPDWYVQAVGSGTGAIASWEAALRLTSGLTRSEKMRLLLVQNSPFAPMVDAWERGERILNSMSDEEAHFRISKIAAKVLSNATPPYSVAGGVYDVLKQSNGDMCQVSNEEVLQAQSITFEMTGFKPCTAASAAVAGLRKFAIQNAVKIKHKRVLLHLTGGGFELMQQEKSMVNYQNSFSIEAGDRKKAIEIIGKYVSKFYPDINLH